MAKNQPISNTPVRMDCSQYLTFCGVEYSFDWIDPAVPAAGKIYLRATTSITKYTILNSRSLKMDQERGFYKAYTGFTGGAPVAAVPVFNLRADTSIATGAVIETFSTPTTIDVNTKTIDEPLFGQAGQGNQPASGDLTQEDAIRVIPPGIVFLIEFENASANPCYFQAELKWWELSPDAVPPLYNI